MKTTVQKNIPLNLAQQLNASGIPLDLRCGGKGTCGRCRVTLLSGIWRTDGHVISVPAEVLACRTFLESDTGECEIPDSSIAHRRGKILTAWRSSPLPSSPDAVVAVDVGTTTIVAVKIQNGKLVDEASTYNPQSRYGDNVITRIQYAAHGELATLQKLAHDALQGLFDQLGMADVTRIAVAGNTVMSCLFHGINPESIGVMPFLPPVRTFPERRDWFGGIPVLTIPAISGYVGGDLTAGLFETKLGVGEMLIDIGTNCEIIFATSQGVFCTSAAAGPAFEGAGLTCGCRAVDGAIDHYFDEGTFSVLGNSRAMGLCGSGLIDFLAVKRRQGEISEMGRYEPKAESRPVTDGIAVHERDLEQILKAKAAVWAGIKTLEDFCGGPAAKIFLAGGFAQFVDLKNAVAIGMLPDRLYQTVGNTSLAGAARLACDPGHARELDHLIDIPREVPLNTLANFEDNFIDGLFLP